MDSEKKPANPFVEAAEKEKEEKRDDATGKQTEEAIKNQQKKQEPDPADQSEAGNPGIDSKGPEATRPQDNKEEEGPVKD